MTVFTAAVGAGSKSPEAAKGLIEFITGPQATQAFKTKGFQPGREPAWSCSLFDP